MSTVRTLTVTLDDAEIAWVADTLGLPKKRAIELMMEEIAVEAISEGAQWNISSGGYLYLGLQPPHNPRVITYDKRLNYRVKVAP